MNRNIRRLGVALMLCYVALFVKLNWIQVIDADDLANNPLNTAPIRQDFNRARGAITSGDGVLLAESIPNPDVDSEFDRLRVYPEGELFGHVTGYFSFQFGASGLEREYSEELTGQTFGQQVRGFADLFVANENVGNMTVSVRQDLQQIARDQLGEREGSVVAIDPRTGEILSFWSYPTFDPNALSGTDIEATEQAWALYNLAPGTPLRAHQYQDRYFPGSTFKVVTGSVGLETGTVTNDEPSYPFVSGYTAPQTDLVISNFGGRVCGGTLPEILAVSCNSSFAQMGTETIGGELMVQGSESWGFNRDVPIDMPAPAQSFFPPDVVSNPPKLAQSSIGQSDVQATPLQMAMVAGAVANGGTMMRPHLMTEIRNRQGSLVDEADPEPWLTPLSPTNAETMRVDMIGVVEDGTATALRIPGFEVGGKTGTAQLGTDPPRSHTWIIGFAGPPGQPATVAVAVVVLDQDGGSEATGGRVAGPIARAVLEAALARP
ncbi:peptidoglycan D,D-transpeptidase FtsI family protein [Rhabdothermincola salaria]|uniref:peptidoglycan D,D-transpeptidase FtsI family protein n=1 Tax=Rhabdothermincola salaria TaxID=2903142 RepID=UPI001E46EBC7|nr:penicillin-binding protein 2 [Rhabdothermincola salaria]